jgi:hypothetical protein
VSNNLLASALIRVHTGGRASITAISDCETHGEKRIGQKNLACSSTHRTRKSAAWAAALNMTTPDKRVVLALEAMATVESDRDQEFSLTSWQADGLNRPDAFLEGHDSFCQTSRDRPAHH